MKTTLWFIKEVNGDGSYIKGFAIYLLGRLQRMFHKTSTHTINL